MSSVYQGNLVLPDEVVDGQLIVESGVIVDILTDSASYRRPDYEAPEGFLVCAGFVDLQINGGFGKEFKTDPDALEVVRTALPQFGTTAFCPTITTLPMETYTTHMAELQRHVTSLLGSRVLGFHLEGPFLNPAKAGAHTASWLREPHNTSLEDYATGNVALVTLAPELGGASDLIRALIAGGKKVGIGHSVVSYEALIDMFDTDNMLIVHVFNAMNDLNSRQPGLVGAALAMDDYSVSLIADGIHVSPATVRILWKCKPDKRRIVCITDGAAVTGMPIGIHQIGTRSIEKRADRAVLEGTTTLVGSTLTLDVAARNLRAFTGCSICEAINAVSLNPATYLGRSHEIGQLKKGCFADLAVLNGRMEVERTFVGGSLAWSRD